MSLSSEKREDDEIDIAGELAAMTGRPRDAFEADEYEIPDFTEQELKTK